jgi:hypothetical protein
VEKNIYTASIVRWAIGKILGEEIFTLGLYQPLSHNFKVMSFNPELATLEKWYRDIKEHYTKTYFKKKGKN